MHWIAPSERNTTTDTLEKGLWNAADQFRAVPFTLLYFATITDDFVGYLTNNASGAAYPAVSATTFEKAELLIPSPVLLKRLGKATIPIADRHTHFNAKPPISAAPATCCCRACCQGSWNWLLTLRP